MRSVPSSPIVPKCQNGMTHLGRPPALQELVVWSQISTTRRRATSCVHVLKLQLENVRYGSHRTCMRTGPWQWHLKSPKPKAPRFWHTIIFCHPRPGRVSAQPRPRLPGSGSGLNPSYRPLAVAWWYCLRTGVPGFCGVRFWAPKSADGWVLTVHQVP